MTKHFCDICIQEIKDDDARVAVYKKYHTPVCLKLCLNCFYDKANWDRIHVQPKPDAFYIQQKKLKRKLRSLGS